MTGEPSPRINVMEYSGKDHMLKVVRAARATFFDLMDQLNDEQWQAQTPCAAWQERDLVGHLVDVTEAYLDRFALARDGKPFPEPLGLRVMGQKLDEGSRRLRVVPRTELIARLKRASGQLFDIFDRLDAPQWTGELIPHVFMGPLPTFFYPAFQLMDYGVHGWDARDGVGRSAPLSEDAAGTLVPFMFILLQVTLAAERAQGLDLTCGIQVSGPYGGTWRVQVKDGAMTYEAGAVDDCSATLSFGANDFVLTSFQRISGGVATGNREVAESFRGLFFTI